MTTEGISEEDLIEVIEAAPGDLRDTGEEVSGASSCPCQCHVPMGRRDPCQPTECDHCKVSGGAGI